ncbi:MAG: hypothetical protein ACP5XB_21180 [Isosphaeraceae bacterium]
MQLLGAWMMSTPLSRAALTVRFIAGASSPTLREAPLHQCWFHMSQMMIAVFAGPHFSVFSLTVNVVPPGAGSRNRACSTRGLASVGSAPRAASHAPAVNAIKPKSPHQMTRMCSVLPRSGNDAQD